MVKKYTTFKSNTNVAPPNVGDNYFKSLQVNIIQIPNTEDNQDLITEVATKLKQKIKFKTIRDLYKEKDITVKLGQWVNYAQQHPLIDAQIYNLEALGISSPITLRSAVYFYQVINERVRPKPKDFKVEQIIPQVQQQYQQLTATDIVETIIKDQSLNVTFPTLKSTYEKYAGNYQLAINAYQLQISQDPNNPIPHYLLGKLYAQMDDFKNANDQFLRTKIKVEANPKADSPYFHIAYADLSLLELYMNKSLPPKILNVIDKQIKPKMSKVEMVSLIRKSSKKYYKNKVFNAVRNHYDRAYEISNKDLLSLTKLSEIYTEVGDNGSLKKVETSIENVQAEIADLIKKQQESLLQKTESESVSENSVTE